jgi:hypothetical protein
MVRVIVESSYSPALDRASELRVNAQLKSQLMYREMCWLRTLFSLDRSRSISELEAVDAESVRELYRIAGVAFDRIWTAQIQAQTPCDCEDDSSTKTQRDISSDRSVWLHNWFNTRFLTS